MKYTIKTLALLVTVLIMSSFTKKNADEFIGSYSVSDSDPDQIKLIINSDHSFYYQDFSISDKKIVSKGTWILRGNKVVQNDNDIKFHNVWTFHKNGKIEKWTYASL